RDGYIVFEGRKDGQVKLNGYRVELDEISSKLAKLPGVENALVTIQDNQLIGYLVSKKEHNKERIIKFLKNYLPEYMIPKIYITIAYLPLTHNGKVSYKDLPKVDILNKSSYIAPKTKLEKQLCQIWEEVLDLDKVGVIDDFFSIGGNSILAIKLSHRLSNLLDNQINVADIFKYRNIVKLSEYLQESITSRITISKFDMDSYPLSFAQERLWFIEQYEQGTNAYHIPLLLSLNKSTEVE
ncbi:phosphopantetheine-binding protein, partial [Francisella philomiragia]|uniref:phosphopantetheine-binding protein n=1 Tax=Francisella philomiragia TaxID=28110 RepID=UPI001C9DCE9D